MEFSDSAKVLCSLGLSEYEAKVYVSLVTEGASEGRKLSMRCGVPRTKVYATLKKLIERGLVYEVPEEPRKFSAMSPAEAFEPYLLHLKEETSNRVISLMESREAVSALEEAYKKTESTVAPQKEEIWILTGQSKIVNKIRETLSRAEKSVNIVTTESGLVLFYKTIGKLLDKLVESGVKVWIGTSVNSHNRTLARELSYLCRIEEVDVSSPLLLLCVDDHRFLLAELAPEDSDAGSSMDFGVFAESSELFDLISLLLPKQVGEAFPRRTRKVHRSCRAKLVELPAE